MPFVPDATASQGGFKPDQPTATPTAAEPPKEEPGMLRKAYEFMGGAPGLAAAAGTTALSLAAPEIAGPAWLIRAAAAGLPAYVTAKMTGEEHPVQTGVTSALGELGGAALAKPLKWAGGKIASSFELGQYAGKIGQKLSDIFNLESPMRTVQDIYNTLHYDPNKNIMDSAAGDAIKAAYRKTGEQIENIVGKGKTLPEQASAKLKQLLFENLPEFEKKITAETRKLTSGGFMEDPMLSQRIAQEVFTTKPLTVEEGMEFARRLSQQASKKSATGAVGRANQEYRDLLARSLDELAPESGAGTLYQAMNANYRRGISTLNSFDVHKLFKTTPSGGPKFDRVAWTQAANDAERTLKKVGAEELDAIIRMGRPPGYTATRTGTHIRVGAPIGLPGLHPGTWLPFHVESPLRPAGGTQIPDTLLRALGASQGAKLGE